MNQKCCTTCKYVHAVDEYERYCSINDYEPIWLPRHKHRPDWCPRLNGEGKMMGNPKCYGCKYLADVFGNHVECSKAAENGTHVFVDWFYYNDDAPECCPLKAKEGDKKNGDTD